MAISYVHFGHIGHGFYGARHIPRAWVMLVAQAPQLPQARHIDRKRATIAQLRNNYHKCPISM